MLFGLHFETAILQKKVSCQIECAQCKVPRVKVSEQAAPAQCNMIASLPGLACVFLLSDAQIIDEYFLVYINDYLSSGQIFDLFTDDEVDEITDQLRDEVKSQGYQESKENIWKYFIDKVQRNLKIIIIGISLEIQIWRLIQ